MYASCYYTGRLASDLPGDMAAPVQYKAGQAPQNNVDGYGRNRWGDYSYTTLDPVDETTFWTLQEYGHGNNIWGTFVGVLAMSPSDCNTNGVPDYKDVGLGTSPDCNANALPDECDIADGTSQDCNANTVPDECDIASGTSPDANGNGIPDECETIVAFSLVEVRKQRGEGTALLPGGGLESARQRRDMGCRLHPDLLGLRSNHSAQTPYGLPLGRSFTMSLGCNGLGLLTLIISLSARKRKPWVQASIKSSCLIVPSPENEQS